MSDLRKPEVGPTRPGRKRTVRKIAAGKAPSRKVISKKGAAREAALSRQALIDAIQELLKSFGISTERAQRAARLTLVDLYEVRPPQPWPKPEPEPPGPKRRAKG